MRYIYEYQAGQAERIKANAIYRDPAQKSYQKLEADVQQKWAAYGAFCMGELRLANDEMDSATSEDEYRAANARLLKARAEAGRLYHLFQVADIELENLENPSGDIQRPAFHPAPRPSGGEAG